MSEGVTLTNFENSEVVSSLCLDAHSCAYWLFRVYEGNVNPRVYRLPEDVWNWPTDARWNHLEDREPLLSIVQSKAS